MRGKEPRSSYLADLISSGNWLKPGQICKMRKRLNTGRRKISVACTNCKKDKLKCDDGRPCQRCVKKGLSCTSEDGNQNIQIGVIKDVERPIRARGCLSFNERNNFLVDARVRKLPSHVSQMHWMLGHHEDDLLDCYGVLPDVLKEIARLAIAAVSVLMRAAPTQNTAPQQMDRQHAFEKARKSLPAEGGAGVLCLWLDRSCMVREGFAANDALSLITGCHVEECCARAARHDVPLPSNEVEGFCTIMDDLLNGQDPHVTRYIRWRKRFMNVNEPADQRNFLFIKQTRLNMEDSSLNLSRMQCTLEVITEEQYEAVRSVDPELCRPFCHLLGDNRPASELMMANAQLDSWQGLMSTEEGRSRVLAMAEALYTRFAPLIAMASSMSGGSVEELATGRGPPSLGGLGDMDALDRAFNSRPTSSGCPTSSSSFSISPS